MKHDRIYQFLLSLVLALLLTTSCDRSSTFLSSIPPSNCRIVQHYAGESCIPLQPKRIVTLDGSTFEYALALGMQPIGSVLDQMDTHLLDRAKGVENVGTAGAPNLEKILQLKPDLILGLDFHQAIYSQATRIAPVVLFDFQHSGQWKEIFMKIGEILDKSDVVEQVLDRYYERIREFKAKTSGSSPSVSVLRIDPISIYPYFKDSFCGVVLQDAGLPRPQAQNLSAAEAVQQFGNPIQTAISKERIDFIEGDVIFTYVGENTIQSAQTAQSRMEKLKSDPIWQNLAAVQRNRVYQVPSYWIGSSPISANLVLDDLFKYLVDEA